MNKIVCLVLLVVCFPVLAAGQSGSIPKADIVWKKLFGGPRREIGWSCLKTNDRGFVVAGLTRSFGAGEFDGYLIKTDHRGNEQWHKTFGGKSSDGVVSVKLTGDNGLIASGYTASSCSGGRGTYLIRLDPDGGLKWEKAYCNHGNGTGMCVIENTSGEYVVCGERTAGDAGGKDVLLLKTDGRGNVIWEKTFGGKDVDVGNNVIQTGDNGYVIGGYTRSFGAGNEDILLIRTDSGGNQIWRRTYGGPGVEYIHGNSGLIRSRDGGFVICGITTSFGRGKEDYYIIRTSPDGDVLWQTYFGGAGDDHPLSVVEVEGGDLVIAGYTKSFGVKDRNSHLLKLDSKGKEKWRAILDGPGFNCAICIQPVKKGEYVVCGETVNNSNGERDVYLMKVRE